MFGYFSDTLELVLENGVLLTADIALIPELSFTASGQVVDANGNGIENVQVSVFSGFITHDKLTDANGNFSLDTMFEGSYSVMAGHWGYISHCSDEYVTETNNQISITLDEGYYDDFTFDFGWEKLGNAEAGIWEIGNPNGTMDDGQVFAPETDANGDCYLNAYVTGNAFGGGVGADDVDGGNTILISPIFDLSSYTKPVISYYRWFANGGGWSAANDSLIVSIHNGSNSAVAESLTGVMEAGWTESHFIVEDRLSPTATMYLTVEANDWPEDNHLLEAGFDLFMVYEYETSVITEVETNLAIYPNPAKSHLVVNSVGEKQVYSLLGEQLFTTNKQVINLSALASGVYILKLGEQHLKFIKE